MQQRERQHGPMYVFSEWGGEKGRQEEASTSELWLDPKAKPRLCAFNECCVTDWSWGLPAVSECLNTRRALFFFVFFYVQWLNPHHLLPLYRVRTTAVCVSSCRRCQYFAKNMFSDWSGLLMWRLCSGASLCLDMQHKKNYCYWRCLHYLSTPYFRITDY